MFSTDNSTPIYLIIVVLTWLRSTQAG